MHTLRKFAAVATVAIGLIHVSTAAADGHQHDHVSTVSTPCTEVELLRALREGHRRVFGTEPSDNRLAMAWGQVALENANGQVVWNHNLGNIGPTKPDQATFLNHRDHNWYRSFFDFEDAAAAYWEVVGRCSAALAAFGWLDAKTAAAALYRCGYYEAPVDGYASVLAARAWHAHRVIEEDKRDEQQRQRQLIDAIKRSIDAGGGGQGCLPSID